MKNQKNLRHSCAKNGDSAKSIGGDASGTGESCDHNSRGGKIPDAFWFALADLYAYLRTTFYYIEGERPDLIVDAIIDDIGAGKITIEGVRYPGSYLRKIAYRKVIDWWRHITAKRHPERMACDWQGHLLVGVENDGDDGGCDAGPDDDSVSEGDVFYDLMNPMHGQNNQQLEDYIKHTKRGTDE